MKNKKNFYDKFNGWSVCSGQLKSAQTSTKKEKTKNLLMYSITNSHSTLKSAKSAIKRQVQQEFCICYFSDLWHEFLKD